MELTITSLLAATSENLLPARLQMAFTLGFHIILACLSVGLACRWQNSLALVFWQSDAYLFYDRSFAGQSGSGEVFYRRIQRYADYRFLGRVQRGGLRRSANVSGTFAARVGIDGAVQVARQTLAGVCQEAAAIDRRCHSLVVSAGRTACKNVCLSQRLLAQAVGDTDRHRLARVFQTLKQHGHDPIQTVIEAIENYITTKQLPPLPAPKSTSDG